MLLDRSVVPRTWLLIAAASGALQCWLLVVVPAIDGLRGREPATGRRVLMDQNGTGGHGSEGQWAIQGQADAHLFSEGSHGIQRKFWMAPPTRRNARFCNGHNSIHLIVAWWLRYFS